MFNETLRKLRAKKNLTQKEVAAMMGVSAITYMKYELGETEPKYSAMMDAMIKMDAEIKDIVQFRETSKDDALTYNIRRAEILNDSEKECLNQVIEAMLIKHQIETVRRQ